ncbi:MAG: hypothetical protein JWO77_3759 [Ilumatobacteraceae bacterium]|nr:hypothetical protein [Ilumatobacteraceae bacterium]
MRALRSPASRTSRGPGSAPTDRPAEIRASAAYGALGVAASALLWLYLLGRLMVAAPVLNATIWNRYHDVGGGSALPSDDAVNLA